MAKIGKTVGKNVKEAIERFSAPDTANINYDENILFECAMTNNYQLICGAFDAKGENPLASYIIEKDLFNKRNQHGKTVNSIFFIQLSNFFYYNLFMIYFFLYYIQALDLAAYCNHKDFIRTILERSNEKLNENVLNLKELIGNTSALNFMHYACIWGSFDVCCYLAELPILMNEPVNETLANQQQQHEQQPQSTDISKTSNLDTNKTNSNMKTIGSILLRQRTRSGETPKELAKRYNHENIAIYLEYSGYFEILVLLI
jgi:hypothetical protein